MLKRERKRTIERERERGGKSFALITIAEFYSICDSHLPNLNEELFHTHTPEYKSRHPHTHTPAHTLSPAYEYIPSYRQVTELSARLE